MSRNYIDMTSNLSQMKVGDSVTATLSYGQAIAYKLTLEAGKVYDFGIFSGDTANNVDMYLYDSTGRMVDASFGHWSSANYNSLDLAIGKSGDYYLEVADFYHTRASAYIVHAMQETQPQDDFAPDASTTGILTPGVALHGNFGIGGDIDWFKFHGEVGKTYTYSFGNAPGTTYTNDSLIYSADGVIQDPDNFPFQPTSTGDYYISMRGDSLGPYDLTLKELTDDYSGNEAFPGQLAIGATADGAMQFRLDRDRFKVNLEAGKSYTFVLNGSAALASQVKLSCADSTDALQDSAVVTKADGKQTLVFTPAKAGVYSLDVEVGYSWTGTGADSQYTLKSVDPGLIGKGNGKILNGGAGIDTAYYDGTEDSYTVSRSGSQVSVQLKGAASGDTLNGVERLQFADHTVALDIDGHGGQAYRLYQAAFNRTPDQDGLGFWIAAMDKGMSLQTVAHGFAMSPEFQGMYGATQTDAQYVSQLYQNVLHRAGDASGTSFWLDALQHGHSRDEVLAFFSESPENQAALIGQISNGITYILHS